MTTTARIAIEHYTDITPVRQTLLDVYADVRADLIHLPHYSVDAYAERINRHATEAGWEAVIGYDRWWTRMEEPLPDGYEDLPTIALKELGIRPAWRKTGASVRLHDALLAGRPEQRATLLVNPKAGNGKVQVLYASWGYVVFNRQQPPGSPPLIAMARTLRR
jgi:GNAT superfamily N-acetyltransferase